MTDKFKTLPAAMKSLWRYNKITGYWVMARPSGYDDTMKNWLRIYQADEPNEYFRLSIKRPQYNPTKEGKNHDF